MSYEAENVSKYHSIIK